MFKRLMDWLEGGVGNGAAPVGPDPVPLAAAVLMAEAASLDSTFGEDERAAIRRALIGHFRLAEGEAETLLETATREATRTAELYAYTRTIKDRLDDSDRIEVIEMLWEVAYADGELHPYEANLLRRVAGLLYVTDRDSGLARQRVLQRLGIDAPEGESED